MRSLRTRILAVVAVAVVAVAAVAIVGIALGGDDGASATRADYRASVVHTRDRVDFALQRITTSESVDELIENIRAASTAVGGAAGDLDEAGVAEGFGDVNVRLIRTLRAFSDELANTAETFADPAFAGTIGQATSLSFVQWDKVNEILAELDEKGIRVQPLARH